MSARVIFPAQRAIEHAVGIPAVVPLRIFPVLWPLWQVETTAMMCDEQEYDLVDRFLMKAVVEGRMSRVDELVGFLGVPEPLVLRCLAYLSTIQHVRVDSDTVRATDLGIESLGAGLRYVWKQSRQKLLIERFSTAPLPRGHYGGGTPVLTEPTVDRERVADGTRFVPLFAMTIFRPEFVLQLQHRHDRAELNLPRQLRDLSVDGDQEVYLPAYIIETASDGLLVYTAAGPARDAFIEDVANTTPLVYERVRAEEQVDPRVLWSEWLANGQAGAGTLRCLPSGVWRATFRADAFGERPKFSPNRVGSFHAHRNHFVQLWCENEELRRDAMFVRALGMVRTREIDTSAELERRVAVVARQLEVTPADIAALRKRAVQGRQYDVVGHLDGLG